MSKKYEYAFVASGFLNVILAFAVGFWGFPPGVFLLLGLEIAVVWFCIEVHDLCVTVSRHWREVLVRVEERLKEERTKQNG